jgi:hypothetical protein
MKAFVLAFWSVLFLTGIQNPVQGKTERVEKISVASLENQNDKLKIKKEELPEAAKKTLEGDAFKGWSVVNVYKVKNGQEYEVELKKENASQVIKFDKDGKVL